MGPPGRKPCSAPIVSRETVTEIGWHAHPLVRELQRLPTLMANTSIPTRQLGRSDVHFTVLTFGCWQAGGKQWTDTNDDDSLAAMRAAYESGITSFDTAEAYGGGHSEELLGRFIKEVGRDNLTIATKVGATQLSTENVRKSCEKSLSRLGIERIDLYQIHWPSGQWGGEKVPIEETMDALVGLQKGGKFGALGVSNFDASLIEQAQKVGRIDSLQPPYSLFFQPYVQNGTIDFCLKNEIGVIPYSPLAQGLVTGKFNMENRPTDNRAGNALFKDPTYGIALDATSKLEPIAQKYDANTAQLALAWLIAQPGVTSPIVGARTPEQIRDTARAATLQIEASDLEKIAQIAQPVLDSVPADQTNPWAD